MIGVRAAALPAAHTEHRGRADADGVEPVRLRVIEVALQWEAERISPGESILLAIYEIAGDDRDLVLDALRFDGSEYARAVMRVIGL